MSLKNLLKRVDNMKNSRGQAGTVEAEKSMINIIYDAEHRTPPEEQIKDMLLDLVDKITKEGLTENILKKLILTSYRLAYSKESRATGCFHPSEISTETTICQRKLYFQKGRVPYDATYVKFTSDNRMQRLVDLGTLVHLYIQENLERAGVLKDFETPVDAPAYGIKGNTDGIVEFSGVDDLNNFYLPEDMILEVKTINEYGFKALRKPKPEHIKQASIYGSFLGLKKICFLYYNKNTSDLKIYVTDIDFKYVEDFKQIAGSIINQFNQNVKKHRSSNVDNHFDIPAKLCKSRSNDRAMNCQFANYCFNRN